MRTLAFKLTLAFLFVGALGIFLVAIFVGFRTQNEFDQFLSESFRDSVAESLVTFYEENGSWRGASQQLMQTFRVEGGMRDGQSPWALASKDGRVILGGWAYPPGELLPDNTLQAAFPLVVDGETVGFLLQIPTPIRPPNGRGERWSPETAFLNRVNQAILYSSLVAIVVALFTGIVLARNIARPIRGLTQATTAVAHGELGRQVDVHGRDEIAELSTSFNQMSRDLAEASHQRRQMTADIAHELRTPLSIILGYTESLRDGILPPDAETFDILHDEAQHLSRLVQDLRTLSLAEAGELSLNLDLVAVTDLLRNVAARYAYQAEQKGVGLQVNVASDLPEIEVDQGRIEQVLSNLVSNALRYTPTQGQITLSASQKAANMLELQVQDTGVGIAPEDVARIFDRFYKVDASRTAENGESGLGLAIARSLVLMHNGRISVQSAVGAGATFTVELPIKNKA